ncbi:GNAT family N-acetyltransferase [Pontibacter sp. G13]|uniref:GNAT family N-acetyltransferase n=1 Tax=Pontibacter sp. G13 TaxID=3074898 RepID=UPI00288A348E|nr:GNAT family N-acetyltransferase [Pontibacter sp. G13]WNJ17443.1 GNAT family N-acetyltransferase [Pontibacter sp. G13]
MDLIIRPIRESDAQDYVRLMEQIERETQYGKFEPGERIPSVEFYTSKIQQVRADEYDEIFLAILDGQLIGRAKAEGKPSRKSGHCLYLSACVIYRLQRQGVGESLVREAEEWAKQKGITRIETSVVSQNRTGVQFWRKMGYQIEGTRRNAFCLFEEMMDEYLMAKVEPVGVRVDGWKFPRW